MKSHKGSGQEFPLLPCTLKDVHRLKLMFMDTWGKQGRYVAPNEAKKKIARREHLRRVRFMRW